MCACHWSNTDEVDRDHWMTRFGEYQLPKFQVGFRRCLSWAFMSTALTLCHGSAVHFYCSDVCCTSLWQYFLPRKAQEQVFSVSETSSRGRSTG